jgi:demethylmenaquinone methyltransferase/2-methoxy-6-polyprenyl-1,4-benzoquinol methylase
MAEEFGPEGYVDFGAREVPVPEKQRLVDHVFDRVASRYDLMNDLMSGGLHRVWKAMVVDSLRPARGRAFTLLDIAGGTGDVAFRFLDRTEAPARAILLDINAAMLQVGQARAMRRDDAHRLALVQASAEALPLASRSLDACTIAFGIRNVTHRAAALSEIFRVLKPGGRFLCLEFSRVDVPMLDRLYDLYSFNAIPAMGRLVAGDADSYRYLVESIRRFPPPERFAGMMREAGFSRVGFTPLAGGVAAIHSGWRI